MLDSEFVTLVIHFKCLFAFHKSNESVISSTGIVLILPQVWGFFTSDFLPCSLYLNCSTMVTFSTGVQ